MMDMRRGKFEKPKRRRNKKPAILIVSLVLLLIAAIGGTVAYLQATSGRLTNTFTPADVEIVPSEKKDSNSKSDIKFQNSGDIPVYIRATLSVYWKDADENIVPQPAGSTVDIGTVLSGWTGVDGIYYYNLQVPPDGWTDPMLSTITVTYPDGYTCHIDVHAQAIQAQGWGDGVDTAQEAWAAAKGVQG